MLAPADFFFLQVNIHMSLMWLESAMLAVIWQLYNMQLYFQFIGQNTANVLCTLVKS